MKRGTLALRRTRIAKAHAARWSHKRECSERNVPPRASDVIEINSNAVVKCEEEAEQDTGDYECPSNCDYELVGNGLIYFHCQRIVICSQCQKIVRDAAVHLLKEHLISDANLPCLDVDTRWRPELPSGGFMPALPVILVFPGYRCAECGRCGATLRTLACVCRKRRVEQVQLQRITHSRGTDLIPVRLVDYPPIDPVYLQQDCALEWTGRAVSDAFKLKSIPAAKAKAVVLQCRVAQLTVAHLQDKLEEARDMYCIQTERLAAALKEIENLKKNPA